nr:GIY-YIG nuclease family protein [Thioalkalivibrio sp. ALJ7]
MTRPRLATPLTAALGADNARHCDTWYVYLLECQGGRIYTGITPHLAARMAAHAAGRGARFTRMHKPVQLLASRGFASRNEALREEYRIKQTPPRTKRTLARQWAAENMIDWRPDRS